MFCLLQALIDANITMTKTSKPKQMAAHPLRRMDTIYFRGGKKAVEEKQRRTAKWWIKNGTEDVVW